MTKVCSSCKREKELSAFYVNAKYRLGVQSTCKPCQSTYSATRRKAGLVRKTVYKPTTKEEGMAFRLKYRFGVSYARFLAIVASQQWKCPICLQRLEIGNGVALDHDHSCCDPRQMKQKTCGACIRGVLCRPCNTALGLMRDNAQNMRRAVEYLEQAASQRGIQLTPEDIATVPPPTTGTGA